MKAMGLGLGAFGFHEVWVQRARERGAVAGRRRPGGRAGRRARRHPVAPRDHATPTWSRWRTSSPSEPASYAAGADPIVTPDEMRAIDAAAPEPVEVLVDRAGRGRRPRPRGRCSAARTAGVVNVIAGQGQQRCRRARRRRSTCAREACRFACSTPRRARGAAARRPRDRRRVRHRLSRRVEGTGDRRRDGAGGRHPERGRRHHGRRRTRGPAGRRDGDVRGGEARAVLRQGSRSWPATSASSTSASTSRRRPCTSSRASDVSRWIGHRVADAHKWAQAVRVVAGSSGMTGAAHLVTAGAQRAGAGMVHVSSPGVEGQAPIEAVSRRIPAFDWADAVLQRPVPLPRARGRARARPRRPHRPVGDEVGHRRHRPGRRRR